MNYLSLSVIKSKQMKTIFLSVAGSLLFFTGIYAQPSPSLPESAEAIMKTASIQAAKENKKVFVIFHASWCGWCHKMDTAMNDASCKDFFKTNFVVTHMVVDESKDKIHLENPGAAAFRQKYGGEGQGIPYWLIFDKDGNLLADSKMRPGTQNTDGDNTGCPASEKEVDYFITVLKKTTSINEGQVAIIRKRFRLV